jgi:uncharacterized protein (TIGR02453 family)
MRQVSHFGPELFQFFRELKANNTREWFLANKDGYETEVKEPMLRFISDFGPHLRKISPSFEAEPRPVGGSMFRIYRDTRFSMDKSPYKTHAAAHFGHRAGKDVHAPGFYLHLDPVGCFAGAGIWHPEPSTLVKIRDAIVHQPRGWERVLRSKLSLEGDKLTRPPRGYDAAHPFVEDLKRKDFVATVPFTRSQVCSPRFLQGYASACKAMSPLVEFLTKALGLAW